MHSSNSRDARDTSISKVNYSQRISKIVIQLPQPIMQENQQNKRKKIYVLAE